MKAMVHWNIFEGRWTVRTYKTCARHSVVLVKNWKTEVKPTKKDNPRGWVYADHTDVTINPDLQMLKSLVKKDKLLYNKHVMHFNIKEGDLLLCDDDGCFIAEANA